ncbi:non-functional pseudokinase ZED1-like [Malus domestica]|uniref:non-functional pseudokinase ZED1-like n=1 Tax=Malus domestica TaxID=3750 RepID=UPI003975B073
MVIHEIIISMQMSTHKNALITLGCYFKFPVPALVHEYITQGFIDCHGGLEDTKSLQWETILLIAKKAKGALKHDGSLRGDNEDQIILPWNIRLRIAKQLASAVSYLHIAFAEPIIHRYLNPSCLFLDDDYISKLYSFSHSTTIPPTESDVEDAVGGTPGFGVLLVVFLTGRTPWEIWRVEGIEIIPYARGCDGRIGEILDPRIYEEVRGNE